MTDLVERLRSTLPTYREDWDGFDPIMAEAADEIERLLTVVTHRPEMITGGPTEEIYEAVVAQRDKLFDEVERLRGAIEVWRTARRELIAGTKDGKPWSSEMVAALGLAEAALAAVVESD